MTASPMIAAPIPGTIAICKAEEKERKKTSKEASARAKKALKAEENQQAIKELKDDAWTKIGRANALAKSGERERVDELATKYSAVGEDV